MSKKIVLFTVILFLFVFNLHAASYLYICGLNDGKLLKMDPESGTIIDTINSGGLDSAQGICVGSDGNLYVSSYNSNQILRYDREGNFIDVFSEGSSMLNPMGMDFGPDGYLYVASNNGTSNFQILKVDPTNGDVSVFANTNPLFRPHGLGFGADGLMYVCTQSGGTVLKYNIFTNTYEGVFTDACSMPMDIIFDSENNAYISDYLNNRVCFFDENGNQIDLLSSGQSGNVYGLALDETSDILYVNDYAAHNVYKFDLSANLLLDTFYTGTNDTYPSFIEFVSFSTDTIPEPSTIALVLLACLSLFRKKNTGL